MTAGPYPAAVWTISTSIFALRATSAGTPHHPVWRIRGRHCRSGAGAQAFTPSTLRHPQTLVAPEPLDVLVIHHSGALGRQHAGRVIG
jgi:hypothetical protein